MENKIKILSEMLINQIAAGEVVERPASVVKELLENAVDAGATEIRVEIQQAGTSQILVTDNGQGMTLEDLSLSIERHATSKIKGLNDLYGLRTMGFRGEALPSIAAVSRLSIRSIPRGADSGHRLEIWGGEKKGAGGNRRDRRDRRGSKRSILPYPGPPGLSKKPSRRMEPDSIGL